MSETKKIAEVKLINILNLKGVVIYINNKVNKIYTLNMEEEFNQQKLYLQSIGYMVIGDWPRENKYEE